MSNWKEELENSAKTPEDRKREEQAKIEASFVSEVLPAFQELKSVLEQQGKRVDVLKHTPAASIKVAPVESPQHQEFQYVVFVDENSRVNASFSYLEGQRYPERQSSIKVSASVDNVTKDEIAENFVKEYKKVSEPST